MQWEKELELKVEDQRVDREVTLGPMTLTALGLGLLVLCCICFIAGYTLGHRSETPNSSGKTASSSLTAATLLVQDQSKRSASALSSRTAPEEETASLSPAAAAQEPAPQPDPEETENSELPSQKPANTPPSAHPALPQYTAQIGSWVVQVAAIENSADSEVLVSALRQRGYAVLARPEAGDNLIHVQVGPFGSRSEADAMRLKLINDGYNANIEP